MEQKTLIHQVGEEMLALFDELWERKNAFFGVFFVLFCLSYGLMVAIDFVPEEPKVKVAAPVTVVPQKVDAPAPVVAEVKKVAAYPVRLRIEKLGTDIVVLNPQDRSVKALDEALLKGSVRHPDSADFTKTGTMLLFGHSSYLPTVFNKNFQAFNGIQKLVEGDVVRVESDDTAYIYHVTKVYKAKASEASVSLSTQKNGLVLVTCNSFGSKDDRYVVEAELAEKVSL